MFIGLERRGPIRAPDHRWQGRDKVQFSTRRDPHKNRCLQYMKVLVVAIRYYVYGLLFSMRVSKPVSYGTRYSNAR